jgi:hypothetical protein
MIAYHMTNWKTNSYIHTSQIFLITEFMYDRVFHIVELGLFFDRSSMNREFVQQSYFEKIQLIQTFSTEIFEQ